MSQVTWLLCRASGDDVRPRSGDEMSAKKSSGWGGSRRGAGRPKGSGSGPSPNARVNRIAVMLTDSELAKLERVALHKHVPVATLAYELMARGLRKAR